MNNANYKNISKQMDILTFRIYFNMLSLLAMSLFEYEGLPKGISERVIEKHLFNEGQAMFFDDDMLGLMCTKCVCEGINPNDEPIDLRPVASNYTNNKSYMNGSECVLIRNNDLSMPTIDVVQMFAYRLTEITRTQDVNINAQKTPILLVCSDKQKLTMKNVYAQYKGNEPVIFGDKGTDFSNITAIKTDAPIVFDKLQLQKHQVMNEFLTFIGVNNANMDKKERLVDDEVQANNEQVECFFNSMLKARKEAVKNINDLFGTNIVVKKRVQSIEVVNDSEEDQEVI